MECNARNIFFLLENYIFFAYKFNLVKDNIILNFNNTIMSEPACDVNNNFVY